MIKVFLSHSSVDKGHYVSVVASHLSKESVVYDELTFESGEKTLLEIVRGLDESTLFALFISEKALDSPWVQQEIALAELRLASGQLKEIYPIIIDRSVKHDDSRIPEWLRTNYNLRLVSRPTVAARRIHQKLRQISWKRHPRLELRANTFVGRNNEIETFERRFDSFEEDKPVASIVAGPPSIGRRTFLKHAMEKLGLLERGRLPPSVYLDRNASLEDFIVKLLDLGHTEKTYTDYDFLAMSQRDKVHAAVDLLLALHDSGERLLVLDEGSLVDFTREPAQWFTEVITDERLTDNPLLFVASRWGIRIKGGDSIKDKAFSTILNELNESERTRLLARLLQVNEITLDRDIFGVLSGLLHGYPDEVHFVVDLVERFGARGAIDRSDEIVEFNSEKASNLLRPYDADDEVLDFVRLLAQFEIYSVDFIFSAISEDRYGKILDKLVDDGICEYVGAEAEFVRLNDSVRDYIKRNRLSLNPKLQTLIDAAVRKTINEASWDDYDSSHVLFAAREALKKGIPVDDRFLIPSHFLRAMKEIYHQRGNMRRVVELADRLLLKENGLDVRLAQDVRYYLCLALARLKDKRVLQEAQKIQGNEHHFVLGYYYRLVGRHKDAIERFEKIVNAPWVEARAKRELVEVYIQTEQYEKAQEFARKNYFENRGNQFHIQAYFRSLIYGSAAEQYADLLLTLCKELDEVGSEQARQMGMIASALVLARIDHDERALHVIDDAIASFPDVVYPVLAKFDIALMFRNAAAMKGALDKLDHFATKQMNISERTYARQRAYYMASIGNESQANAEVDKYLKDFPDDARQRIRDKLRQLAMSASRTNGGTRG